MAPPKKSLAFSTVGTSMMVLRGNKDTPSDEDWDAVLIVLARSRENLAKVRILVITDGGGPDQAQRMRLEVALGGRPIRVAVVTESVKVRFIVSSIALINRDIRTYSPREISEAYRYLDMTEGERRLADEALRELDTSVEL